MVVKDASDEKDEALDQWVRQLRAPAASPAIEARLRLTFRAREARKAGPKRAWATLRLVAALILLAAGASYVGRTSTSRQASPVLKPVVTAASLEGFEPIARPKVVRWRDGGQP